MSTTHLDRLDVLSPRVYGRLASEVLLSQSVQLQQSFNIEDNGKHGVSHFEPRLVGVGLDATWHLSVIRV